MVPNHQRCYQTLTSYISHLTSHISHGHISHLVAQIKNSYGNRENARSYERAAGHVIGKAILFNFCFLLFLLFFFMFLTLAKIPNPLCSSQLRLKYNYRHP